MPITFIERALNSHGILNEPEITYLRENSLKTPVRKILNALVDKRTIKKVLIKELGNIPYYIFPEALERTDDKLFPDAVHILSPFDNMIIQRKRIRDLFGFDYTMECYLPVINLKIL